MKMTPPRELQRLRKMAEGKILLLGFGPSSAPLGIFTTVDGAIWSMRHFKPYNVARSWWIQFYDVDMIDKKGSYCHSVHDNIVRYVFEKEAS